MDKIATQKVVHWVGEATVEVLDENSGKRIVTLVLWPESCNSGKHSVYRADEDGMPLGRRVVQARALRCAHDGKKMLEEAFLRSGYRGFVKFNRGYVRRA